MSDPSTPAEEADHPSLTARTGSAIVWRAVELGGAKLVYLVRLLVLARLLSPDDFGLVALALIPIGVLLRATDLGMIPALVQRRTVDRRHLDAAWTVGVSRSLLIACVVLVAAPLIGQAAGEPRVTLLIRVLALRPVLEAAASIGVAELVRRLQFRALTWIRLTAAVVEAAVSVALAIPLGVWALVIGALAGAATRTLASYLAAPHRPRLLFDRRAIASLVRFGRWVFVTGLVAVVAGSLFKLVIARRLGTAELGLYTLAARLAFLPAEAATEVAGAVAFPLFASLQSDLRKAGRVFAAALSGMAAALVPLTALLLVLAPSLVTDLLGPKWEGTTALVRLLAVAALVGLFGELVVPVFQGFGRPERVAMIEVVQSTLLILLAWYLTARLGIVGAAAAWLLPVALSQVLNFVFLRGMLERPYQGLAKRLTVFVTVAMAAAALASGLDRTVGGLGGLVLAGGAGAGLALTLLWAADRRLGLGLIDDLTALFPRISILLPGHRRADYA